MDPRKLPPLFPEASPSGIVVTPAGERVVAESRRPDGTYRKALRVRPGYTPDEDISRYRTARSAEADARAAVKGRIPGLLPPSQKPSGAGNGNGSGVGSGVDTRGMSKSQKKNALRKVKRKEGGGEEEEDGEEEDGQGREDTPDDWDNEVEESGAKGAEKEKGKVEGGWRRAEVEEVKKVETPPVVVVVEESKRVRALKKKLKQAQQLKERDALRLYLPPAERAKMNAIPELEAELAKLELNGGGADEEGGADA